MPKCNVCGRYFKTSNGFRSHLSMVRRTGRHQSSGRRYGSNGYRGRSSGSRAYGRFNRAPIRKYRGYVNRRFRSY